MSPLEPAVESPMQVAYFVNQYPKVSHTFIRREILALEAQGVRVHRFALRGWDADLVDAEDEAERRRTRFVLSSGLLPILIDLLRVCVGSPGRALQGLRTMVEMARGGDRTWAHHAVSLAEAARLARWMRHEGLDHVHAHFGTNSAEVAMMAAGLAGARYSFTVHGSDEWDQPRQYKLREKIAGAAFVVGISQFTRSQLMRWSDRRDHDRLHVVRCGLDQGFLDAAPVPVPDVPRLVCVGRLCTEKSQGLLVEAVARLRERGVPVQLVLAGDGDDRAELERRIREHRLEDRIEITGWIDARRVRELINGSRGLVLPSLMEALPVVLMEAMALGRPVVSTYVGGIAELVRPGQDGWLVPPGDVEALADAMAQLLATPVETLERRGASARARVLQRHDVRTEAAALRRLFEAATVADRRHSPSAARSERGQAGAAQQRESESV